MSGAPYWPLIDSRLRFFGGTTNHWAGFCRPLEPIDFEERDWVPWSGWPLDHAQLAPYYDRARPVIELPPAAPTPVPGAKDPLRAALPLPEDRVRTVYVQFSPPTRFGRVYRERIEKAGNVHLILYANATHLQRAPDVAAITHVRATSLRRNPFDVKARIFVLATGAIENARLLLASNDVEPTGIGNHTDVVGRYFLDHPVLPRGARWLYAGGRVPGHLYLSGRDTHMGLLAIADGVQRKERLLRFSCRLDYRPAQESLAPVGYAEKLAALPDDLLGPLSNVIENFRADVGARHAQKSSGEKGSTTLACFVEQNPDPENRVSLADERDALGVPRPRLRWTLSEQVFHSLRRSTEILAHEVGRLGLGRVQLPEDGWKESVTAGTHHMGTTRMATNPKQGVVDANCKVHGLSNLYAAGSSVFPTGGTQNPTTTLVALAIRLADEIKRRFA